MLACFLQCQTALQIGEHDIPISMRLGKAGQLIFPRPFVAMIPDTMLEDAYLWRMQFYWKKCTHLFYSPLHCIVYGHHRLWMPYGALQRMLRYSFQIKMSKIVRKNLHHIENGAKCLCDVTTFTSFHYGQTTNFVVACEIHLLVDIK